MSLFQSKQQDGTVSLRVCGYVTKTPYIPDSKKVVLFTVSYGKDKYMDCKAWADTAFGQLAACLEKGDEVAVDGVYERYDGKDGKPHDQLRVDHLAIQMQAPVAEEADAPDPIAAPMQKFEELSEEDDGGELPF